MLVKIGSAWIDPEEITAISLPSDTKDPTKIIVTLRQGVSVWPDATMDEAEAVLIDAGYIENPYPENDTPDLTDGELEVAIELLDDGFIFLARDGDGKLYAFRYRPDRDGAYWNSSMTDEKPRRVNDGFDFISSEDAEPWRISELAYNRG